MRNKKPFKGGGRYHFVVVELLGLIQRLGAAIGRSQAQAQTLDLPSSKHRLRLHPNTLMPVGKRIHPQYSRLPGAGHIPFFARPLFLSFPFVFLPNVPTFVPSTAQV